MGGRQTMNDAVETRPASLSSRLTRREALKRSALTGLGMALLSACGQQAPSAPQPAQSGPAPQPAAPAAPVAAKAPEAAKPAAGTVKEGGSFRFYLHTENAPTLDPYLNVSFRSQEFAAYF